MTQQNFNSIIKELELEVFSICEWKDYANLDYVDKIHIINIINKRAGDKLK